jgi:hypothetical protein
VNGARGATPENSGEIFFDLKKKPLAAIATQKCARALTENVSRNRRARYLQEYICESERLIFTSRTFK